MPANIAQAIGDQPARFSITQNVPNAGSVIYIVPKAASNRIRMTFLNQIYIIVRDAVFVPGNVLKALSLWRRYKYEENRH